MNPNDFAEFALLRENSVLTGISNKASPYVDKVKENAAVIGLAVAIISAVV